MVYYEIDILMPIIRTKILFFFKKLLTKKSIGYKIRTTKTNKNLENENLLRSDKNESCKKKSSIENSSKI